jgi:hypothetical protein
MDTCSNESAEAVSGYIGSTLDKHEITSKCVAFVGIMPTSILEV